MHEFLLYVKQIVYNYKEALLHRKNNEKDQRYIYHIMLYLFSYVTYLLKCAQNFYMASYMKTFKRIAVFVEA